MEQELIRRALEMFKDSERVYMPPYDESIKFKWAVGKGLEIIRGKEYSFCNDKELFRYDPETDTLTNWGRGLGIVYHKGVWARKTPFPIIEVSNYQIY